MDNASSILAVPLAWMVSNDALTAGTSMALNFDKGRNSRTVPPNVMTPRRTSASFFEPIQSTRCFSVATTIFVASALIDCDVSSTTVRDSGGRSPFMDDALRLYMTSIKLSSPSLFVSETASRIESVKSETSLIFNTCPFAALTIVALAVVVTNLTLSRFSFVDPVLCLTTAS